MAGMSLCSLMGVFEAQPPLVMEGTLEKAQTEHREFLLNWISQQFLCLEYFLHVWSFPPTCCGGKVLQ